MKFPTHVLSALFLLLLFVPAPSEAREEAKVAKPLTDKEREAAITKASRWMEQHVMRLPDVSGTPRKQFVMATYGIVHAMLEDRGIKTESRGAVGGRVEKYLLGYLDEVERRSRNVDELPPGHGVAVSGKLIQYTWPLGMSLVFFCDRIARRRNPTVARKAALRILDVLAEARQENGGFGHGRVAPASAAAESPALRRLRESLGDDVPEVLKKKLASGQTGYPNTLVITSDLIGWAGGLARPVLRLDRMPAVEGLRGYLRTAQLRNGSFPYDPSQRSADLSRTNVARTAGTICALDALGTSKTDTTLAQAWDYMDREFEYADEGHGSSVMGLWFAAMACRHADPGKKGVRWERFKRVFFRRIVEQQQKDGAFHCICRQRVFGATNDTNPMATPAWEKEGAMPGAVRKVARSGGGLPRMFQQGTHAYVTVLHTWILLLETHQPALRGRAPVRHAPVITPR